MAIVQICPLAKTALSGDVQRSPTWRSLHRRVLQSGLALVLLIFPRLPSPMITSGRGGTKVVYPMQK